MSEVYYLVSTGTNVPVSRARVKRTIYSAQEVLKKFKASYESMYDDPLEWRAGKTMLCNQKGDLVGAIVTRSAED